MPPSEDQGRYKEDATMTKDELREAFLVSRAKHEDGTGQWDIVQWANVHDLIAASPDHFGGRVRRLALETATLAKTWMIWIEYGKDAALMWKLCRT
jgi:hypothetical protein